MKSSTFCHLVARFRPVSTNWAKVLGQAAVVAALGIFMPKQAEAQTTNWLYFPFTGAPGSTTSPSSTSLGGIGGVNLTGYNGAGTAQDFHGAIGSGVDGAQSGARALCLTNGDGGTQPANATTPPSGASAANCVADLNDPMLANTISNFVVSMWFNQPVKAPSGSGWVLPRMFVLSPSGGNDGAANSLGVKFQQENQFIFSMGATTLTTTYGAGTYPAGDFGTNQWYFVAWAYDSTNLYQYTGSASTPATLVNQVSAPGLKVSLGATPTLVVGNRNFEGARGFNGWIQNFRLDLGIPTNPAAFTEAIRQASPSIILNVNFKDDSVNVDYGGGNAPAPSTMSGAAVVGSTGDIWNGLGGFAYSSYPGGATYTSPKGSLYYTDGSNSLVTVTLSAPSGTYDANSVNWGNFSPFSWASLANEQGGIGYPYTPYAALMASCITANSTTASGFVTLSNLSPNAIYNLYTYNSSDNNEGGGRTSTFTVNGVTQTSTYDGATTNLVNGVDYLEFAGVAADANGTLTIGFGNKINSESDLNGFQLQFVSGTPPASLSTPPTLSLASNLNNLTLCTNTQLTGLAASVAGVITNVQAIITTSTLGPLKPVTVTNNINAYVSGLNTATATISYPLTTNVIYKVTVIATDSNSNSVSAAVSFDTISPTLVIEATDFNYGGGGYLDTPPNGGLFLFTNQAGSEGVDEHKNTANTSTKVAYRASDEAVIQNAGSVTFNEQKFAVAGATELCVDYTSSLDWLDYTRTYGPGGSAPAGTYDVYLCMGTFGTGIQSSLYQISGDPTSQQQTTNFIGYFGTSSFSEQSWAGYEYVPLTDQYGNLVSTTIPAGPQTLRISQIDNPNIEYLMLMPVAPVLTPGFNYFYPDGSSPFQFTNKFTFTVGPNNGSNIVGSGIDVVLNGVDVTSSPGFSVVQGAGGIWTVSYPLQANGSYSAIITVSNTAGLSSSLTLNFDTFNINNYQWEAVDYDFSATDPDGNLIGGEFIDNPVPTGDTTLTTHVLAANSYAGFPADLIGDAVAQPGVDINWVPVAGQTADYRVDSVGSQPSGDYVRPKFLAAQQQFGDPNIGPFNIGYYTTGSWLNYTRHYPTNNYYIWGRLAGGNGAYTNTIMSLVTSGVGTTNQITQELGTFADPNAAGWQAYHWIPLLDTNGNMVDIQLGGLATFRLTSGNNINPEYFMLVQAPVLFKVTPSLVGGQLNLSFPTETGHNYQVMYSATLTKPSVWSPVGGLVPGTGSAVSVLETLTGAQGYYTVTVQ